MQQSGIIIKIRDRYFEWWEGAPTGGGMTEEGLWTYIRDKYGVEEMQGLPDRMKRVHATGTSHFCGTLNKTIAANKAGDNGDTITADEIYDRYT